MGFASPLLLALLGLSSVDGFWFGGMQERDVGFPPLQRRQTSECNTGSTHCGAVGCIPTAACCNAEADWSCLEGNACYTVDGMVDCYTTTIPMPTISRACYDYTQTGCRGGLSCFQCKTSSIGYCVTTVILSGTDTWLNCYTRSTIVTTDVSQAPKTTAESSTASRSTPKVSITSGPATTRPTPSSSRTTTSPPSETSTSDDGGLSGGAIAGIVIGSFAVLTIAAVSLFLCLRKKPETQQPVQPVPQQPPQHIPYNEYQQPLYQHAPMQQQYPPQPPYSPGPQYVYPGAPGMQHAGAYPGIQSPASPVYQEPTKEPTTFPAELSDGQR